MSLYAINDTTLTALGDAVRNKTLGTAELPTLSVEKQYVAYNKAYPYEMPSYVKRIKITGTIDFSLVSSNETFKTSANGTQGLGMAFGYISSHNDVRKDDSYVIVWNGYSPSIEAPTIVEFETMVEGNTWTFIATKYSSSEQCFNLNFTAIGLDENGNEFKYTPEEMVDTINGLMTLPVEALIISGDCQYRFASNGLNWLINTAGDKITTKKITNPSNMFYQSSALKSIPFEINLDNSTYQSVSSMFSGCSNLKALPRINNAYPSNLSMIFYGCEGVREIPDNYTDGWNFTRIHTYNYSSINYVFYSMQALRKIPVNMLKELWSIGTSSSYTVYNNGFGFCYLLDDIVGLAIHPVAITSNCFTNAFNYCHRLKDVIFDTNEDGTAKTAQWKSQTIDLTMQIGYAQGSAITKIQQELGTDKEVKDDATYQTLKYSKNWWTQNINYSRYNHDSAVNTINSLPDCSASGTNTIKFTGNSGALTDGGAINTLTEEEIAVATAKGWTVSLV